MADLMTKARHAMTKARHGLARVRAAARRFARDTSGTVGVASIMLTVMGVTGTAFLSDHMVLLHQRDILRAAASAASIATTREMGKLPDDLTAAELTAQLEPMAERYVLANLPEGLRESAEPTLVLTLTPDREAGLVGVAASADLGGAIFGRHMWGAVVERTAAQSGAERVVIPVDLVLAIDVTGSMNASIHARGEGSEADRRINVVRNAALTLIEALYDQGGGETGHVSIGLVPFNTTVNVGPERLGWVSDLGQGHKVIPERFGPWRGCIENRVMANDLDLSLVTPDVSPFTSWFAPNTLEFRKAERDAIAAEVGEDVVGENDWPAAEEGSEETTEEVTETTATETTEEVTETTTEETTETAEVDEVEEDPYADYTFGPHYGCPLDRIIPLTNDRTAVEQAVTGLVPWWGGGTMSHLGVVWGRRLLAPEWRTAWGLPRDRAESGRQKVLVFLTDGVNDAYDNRGTYPGDYRHGSYSRTQYTSQYTGYGRSGTGTVEEGYRTGTRLSGLTNDADERDVLNAVLASACDLAKADGISVFTVSAVPRGHPRETELSNRLTACATSADHAFVENNDPEGMKTAFRQIGRMVAGFRRTMEVVSGS